MCVCVCVRLHPGVSQGNTFEGSGSVFGLKGDERSDRVQHDLESPATWRSSLQTILLDALDHIVGMRQVRGECACVCVYAYMRAYVCASERVFVRACERAWVRSCACVRACVRACVFVSAFMCVHQGVMRRRER